MKKNLRMAVIGVGAMGQGHCKTLAVHVPDVTLTAVCDALEQTARAAGERLGVPWFSKIDDLLQTGCADAALVVVPHPPHG